MARTIRSGDESCSQSSIGLDSVSFSPYIPHPQSWTVVPEYNMALRQQKTHQPFSNWKYDVKCQIANISQQLQDSLEEHPDNRPRGRDVAWRPNDQAQHHRQTRDDLPLYQSQKRPFTDRGPPPPTKEATEGYYRANSTEDPSYALSFGLGKRTITR